MSSSQALRPLQPGTKVRILWRIGGSSASEASTLLETNSWHLKIDGWNTSFLLGWPIFRCYVSFREGM